MTRFQKGQRVLVTNDRHGLKGECGTVVRQRQRFDSAWVCMDRDLPAALRHFPPDDARGHARYIDLLPAYCEPIAEQVPA